MKPGTEFIKVRGAGFGLLHPAFLNVSGVTLGHGEETAQDLCLLVTSIEGSMHDSERSIQITVVIVKLGKFLKMCCLFYLFLASVMFSNTLPTSLVPALHGAPTTFVPTF